MNQIGSYIVPICVGIIILIAIIRKVSVFDEFLKGAREGMKSAVNILPALVGLVVSISMLRASGVMDAIVTSIRPLMTALNFPAEVVPLGLMRPISGSGALAVLEDIFKQSGPDSYAGQVASVIMGSTETTFYTIAIYYGSIGIKKLGPTVSAALCADVTGFVVSALVVSAFGTW